MTRAATWVDLETAMLCELSQKEEEKYMILLIQRLLKKNDTNELIYKAETDSQT